MPFPLCQAIICLHCPLNFHVHTAAGGSNPCQSTWKTLLSSPCMSILFIHIKTFCVVPYNPFLSFTTSNLADGTYVSNTASIFIFTSNNATCLLDTWLHTAIMKSANLDCVKLVPAYIFTCLFVIPYPSLHWSHLTMFNIHHQQLPYYHSCWTNLWRLHFWKIICKKGHPIFGTKESHTVPFKIIKFLACFPTCSDSKPSRGQWRIKSHLKNSITFSRHQKNSG